MYASEAVKNVNARDLDRYKQLLLTKRGEIEAAAIRTIGAAGGPRERQADVIDQATEAAEMGLQVHLHQTDSRLLRAIEETWPGWSGGRLEYVRRASARSLMPGWTPCRGPISAATARSDNRVERLSSLGGSRLDVASGLDRVGDLSIGRDPQPAHPPVVSHPFADLWRPY